MEMRMLTGEKKAPSIKIKRSALNERKDRISYADARLELRRLLVRKGKMYLTSTCDGYRFSKEQIATEG